MGRPRKYASAEEARVAGDWRGVAYANRVAEAERPHRPNLLPADPASILSEPELRESTPRLLGYDPWATAPVGHRYDHAAGVAVVRFFHERLTHVKGHLALSPVRLEPWQQAVLMNAFGWKRADGLRRYRSVFVFVPRKNGKTTMAAGIVLYFLHEVEENGQEVYSAAADLLQAALIYDTALGMVTQDDGLSHRIKERAATKKLDVKATNSFYRALSADAKTKHGLNPSCFVVDELHAQPDRKLVDVLETGVGARLQPMKVYITTSDFARESICNEMHDYAVKVKNGTVQDPEFLPAVWEAAPEDDWTAPETWRKANPSLGVSVTEEFLAAECRKAKESPEFLNTFKRLYLNLRTESDVAWLPLETWDGCGEAVPVPALAGRPCYAGLDLASTQDLTALVLLFPEDGNAVLPFFFVPEETARKREARGVKPSYVSWKQRGFMEFTPGNVCDYSFVRAKVNELAATYDLRGIAYDPWGAQQLATDLQGDGFNLVQFRQGYASLSAPSKELEKLLVGKQLRHGGHPVLRWCAGNVMVETDAAGNIKPSKAKSGDKIDGVVALVMALGLAIAEAAPAVPMISEL